MKNFTTTEMEIINKMIVSEIPAMIQAGCTIEQYYSKRAELNVHLIQFAVGGEMTEKKAGKNKGENTFKFNRSLPTASQVAKVAALVNTFVATTEKNLLEAQVLANIDEGEDMSIPTEIIIDAAVTPIEKATNKALKAAILGESGISYYEMQLSGLDIVTLAGIGEDARKRHNLTMTCIIAGATVLVAGAAVGGYIAYKKHEEKKEVDYIELEEIEPVEIELDEIEVPEVVID